MSAGARRGAARIARAALLILASLTGACAGAGPSFISYAHGPDAVAGARREGRLHVRWSRRMAPELEGPFLPIERAVAAFDPMGDRIYVGSSVGDLWAFDGRGAEIWMYHAGGGIGSQPLLDADRDELYVASDDGLLHALVASTGAVRWTAEVGGAVGRPPVAAADALYLVTDSDLVVAYDRINGEALWRYRREAPEGFYIAEHAGITLLGTRLITGFTDGAVLCLDARDGAVLWTRDTLADVPDTGAELRFTDVDSTPLVIGEHVYVASFAAGLYELELANGSVNWIHPELTGVTGIQAAAGRLLILSSGDLGVVAFDPVEREIRWEREVERGAPTPPLVVGDIVVVGESEGGLVAYSLADGRELTRVEDEHGFAATPSAAMGLGAAVSNSGKVFVFELTES